MVTHLLLYRLLLVALVVRGASPSSFPALPHHTFQHHSLWIERAAHPFSSSVQHMGIDHGRADVLMAQEFLHGANIITAFQEVGRKAMTQGMATPWLVDTRSLDGHFYRFLQHRVRHMMPLLTSRSTSSSPSPSMPSTMIFRDLCLRRWPASWKSVNQKMSCHL